MGELFTKMSSLVMEQSETILRIEDDVEIGLENTAEVYLVYSTNFLNI
jgi:t-SNARE complex subunit (syntaxin)